MAQTEFFNCFSIFVGMLSGLVVLRSFNNFVLSSISLLLNVKGVIIWIFKCVSKVDFCLDNFGIKFPCYRIEKVIKFTYYFI